MLSADALETVAAAIREAGMEATIDLRDLRPPAVWLRFDGYGLADGRTTLGGRVVRVSVFAVVPSHSTIAGDLTDLDALWETLEPVLAHYGGDAPPDAVGLALPSAPTYPLPALRAPLELVTYPEG